MEDRVPNLKIDYPKHDKIAATGDDDKSPLLAKDEHTSIDKTSQIHIKYKLNVK